MEKILSLSLTELAQAYKQKLLSVSQVIQLVKAQITVMESLNAIISVTSEERISKACASAQHRQDHDEMLGPLDGVPVVVKDNYCTSWCRTTCGSHMLSNYTPPYSATLISRLEAAGAIIMGKSNMDEFGMGSGGTNSVFGPSRNLYRSGKPYHLENSELRCGGLPGDAWMASGGSSGGSAVAVAAGMAFGALGSDTGGSVRNPAALCGLVGLKPSYGLLSRLGLVSLVNSMDCPGVLARSSADCEALLTALLAGGADPLDSTHAPPQLEDPSPLTPGGAAGLRVGVPAEYHCAGLHAQVLAAWRRVADLLADAGARVEQVSLPHTPYAPSCYTVLNTCEVASNYTRYTGVEYGLQVQSGHSMEAQYALTRAAGLSQVVRDRILAGNYFLLRSNSDVYLQQAMKVRRLIKQDFDAVWRDGVDVLLTPTTLFPAPPPELFMVKNYSELTYLQDLCTSPANLAGLPALSLPVGYTVAPSQQNHDNSGINEFLAGEVKERRDAGDNQCNLSGSDVAGEEHHIEGLPLALQLIAPYAHDRRLLHTAKFLEEALDIPKLVLQDPL